MQRQERVQTLCCGDTGAARTWRFGRKTAALLLLAGAATFCLPVRGGRLYRRATQRGRGVQVRKVSDQEIRPSNITIGNRVEVTPRMVGAFLPAGNFNPSGRAETAMRATDAAMAARTHSAVKGRRL